LPHRENQFLALLSDEDLASLRPYLSVVSMNRDDVLAEPHQKIRRVYFPHGGIISCVVQLQVGGVIETGMIGRDGVMGGAQALDHKVSVNKTMVRVPSKASVIDPERLRTAAEESRSLRSMLVCYEEFFSAQVQQTAACNASHNLERRMCRWLLRMRDLIGTELPLTQEFLAQMIGVTRTSVSFIAQSLQKEGLIKYARGHVKIIDNERLHLAACECHDAVRNHYLKIFENSLCEKRPTSDRT